MAALDGAREALSAALHALDAAHSLLETDRIEKEGPLDHSELREAIEEVYREAGSLRRRVLVIRSELEETES